MRPLKPLPEDINNIKIIKDLGMNNEKPRKRIAIFRCKCGKEFIAKINSVKSGQRYSCGCARNGKPTHNLSKHPLYRKWSGMIMRTENAKENNFKRYGGRGIKVCDEWRNNFMSFYNWAINSGYKEGLTIDRINVDGNYEPSNCQWLTMKENTIKDMKKFTPSNLDIFTICNRYINENITVTKLAKEYNTHKQNISNILKEQKIEINKNRRLTKCIIN